MKNWLKWSKDCPEIPKSTKTTSFLDSVENIFTIFQKNFHNTKIGFRAQEREEALARSFCEKSTISLSFAIPINKSRFTFHSF